jgi:hypothetical protein
MRACGKYKRRKIRIFTFEELNVLLGGLQAFPGAYKSFTEVKLQLSKKKRFLIFNKRIQVCAINMDLKHCFFISKMYSLYLYHLDARVIFLCSETQVEPQEPRQEAPESGEETQVEPRPEPRQPRQGEGRKEEAGPFRLLQPPQVPEEEQAINPWPCCTDMCCSIYSKKPVFCIRIFS